MKNSFDEADELDGFEDLNDDDQEKIRKAWADGKVADEDGYVSEDEDEALPKGMVPMADMLNADADRNNVGAPPPQSPPQQNLHD